MTKILSIIIPSCNMERYMDQCIQSLLIPSIADIEILVINDGSKDRTSEIAHGYEAQYPHSIRVIDKSNGHYGSCINRGLKEASGKYIKVLDADDSFDNLTFQHYVEFLKKQDADLVISDYCIVDEEGSVSEVRKMLPQEFDNVLGIAFSEIVNCTYRKFFAMHALAYRLAILKSIGYSQTEGVSYTDQEWVFMPMTAVKTTSYFSESLYKYLIGRTGQSVGSDIMLKSMPLQLRLIKKRLDFYAKNKHMISESHKRYLEGQLYQPIINTYLTILTNKSLVNLWGELCEWDIQLESLDNDLYSRVGEHKFSRLRLKLIKYWRNHNRDLDYCFLLRVIQKLMK